MVQIYPPGQKSVSLTVMIVNDAGQPVTGLIANTWPATYLLVAGQAVPTALTITNLAAVDSAWSAGGLKELVGGRYRLDLPNSLCATDNRVVNVVADVSDKHLLHPPIQVSSSLVGKRPRSAIISMTTGGTQLQFDCWLEQNGGPLNLHTLDPSATCTVTVWMHDADVAQFTLATSDFGAPDSTIGRFRAVVSNPNLTSDRIYLMDVTIASEGVTYSERLDFGALA